MNIPSCESVLSNEAPALWQFLPEFVPVPVLGPDLVDLRQIDLIRDAANEHSAKIVQGAEDEGLTAEVQDA